MCISIAKIDHLKEWYKKYKNKISKVVEQISGTRNIYLKHFYMLKKMFALLNFVRNKLQ